MDKKVINVVKEAYAKMTDKEKLAFGHDAYIEC